MVRRLPRYAARQPEQRGLLCGARQTLQVMLRVFYG